MIPQFDNEQTRLFFYDLLLKEDRVVRKSEVPQDVYEDLLAYDKAHFKIYKRHSSLRFE